MLSAMKDVPAIVARIVFCILYLLISPSGAAGPEISPQTEPDRHAEADTPVSPSKDIEPSTDADQVTAKQIETLKQQVADASDLDEESRRKLSELCDNALADLQRTNELQTSSERFSRLRQEAARMLADLKVELESPVAVTHPQIPEGATIAQLDELQKQTQKDLEAAQQTLQQLEAEPTRRAERTARIPEEINDAEARLSELREALSASAPETQTLSERASRLSRLTQKQRLEVRLQHNQEEKLYYAATAELLPLQRDQAAREVSRQQELVKFWQSRITQARRLEAEKMEQLADRARQQASQLHPLIQELAQENSVLTKQQRSLVERIDATAERAKLIAVQLDALQKDYEALQRRLGDEQQVTHVMGALLLTRRSKIPDVTENIRLIRSRLDEIAQAQLDGITYEDAWTELRDVPRYTETLIGTYQPPIPQQRFAEVEIGATEYLSDRREILRKLADATIDYLEILVQLDADERALIEQADQYQAYIEERILWVKTVPLFRAETIGLLAEGTRWLFSKDNWGLLGKGLAQDLRSNWSVYGLVLLAAAVLFLFQARLVGALKKLSEKTQQVYSDSIKHTIKAIPLTAILSAPGSLLLGLLSWRISGLDEATRFSESITVGLAESAWVLFCLVLTGHFFRPNGLARIHFGMDTDAVRHIKQTTGWFTLPVVFLIFIIGSLDGQGAVDSAYRDTLGRTAYLLCLILVSLYLAITLKPSGPLLGRFLETHPNGWLSRLRYVWYPLICVVPLLIGVVALRGYYYGAELLTDKLRLTLMMSLAIGFAYAILIRWLLVTQKVLLVKEQRRQIAEALKKHAEAANKDRSSSQDIPVAEPAESPEDIIAAISQQTRRLLRAMVTLSLLGGIWWVWHPILGTLGGELNVELWSTTTAGGEVISIGLINLAMAILIFVVTMIFTVNIPGLLEIAVLQRLPLDAATRFAITTLTRYIIVVVGLSLTFGKLGIGWSKIQWLVAAVSVGLGFGLQEIFANFISGIMILFAQPIRVGDIVTVDNVSGTVTKISIRATTITDWDRKEYLVPNKEFITGRLLNWTLSNPINRVVIPVGVAYGSDVELALKTLTHVAKKHPDVMPEPAPLVTFEGFGDSTLNLVLRCYLPNLDRRLSVISELHSQIDAAFRQANLEIAFPQQDLHIRSIDQDVLLQTSLRHSQTGTPSERPEA